MGSFLLRGDRRCAASSSRVISAITRRWNLGSSVIRSFDRRPALAADRPGAIARPAAYGCSTALGAETASGRTRGSGGPAISSETRRISVTLGNVNWWVFIVITLGPLTAHRHRTP